MTKTRQLVIIGDSAFAEIAFELFTHDSPYEVVAFGVERAYLRKAELLGLPVVPADELKDRFLPGEHDVFVAVTYGQLNRLRKRLLEWMRGQGYRPASYIRLARVRVAQCDAGRALLRV
ncbi:MAG: hypothetical protein U5L03_02010 [Burkholderiaceae bacterium]|nr:hypothetical protein [Burkholderiaceae bacterium]